ncbi:mandelate racemase/muconate lactonizing enzyme family protein [Occultella kanbiaonis]|uniref:mandelate racemase/muconate lactonizing enzyme family protein n=1 Tax=Occultella kanbiaonis TaxID=2675754 RepID=UPI001A9812BE|nr:enolase C-terminal domain-like protein [Occultella kanbiaonis]
MSAVQTAPRAGAPRVSSRIAAVEVFAVPVPFKHRFVLGSGSVGSAHQDGDVLFVRITADDGQVGWGEQRALPSWSHETIETMAVIVRRYLTPLLIGTDPTQVEAFHRRASALLSPSVSSGFPFARAAVDIALHDLAGRVLGLPVHALLGGATRTELPLCSAIGVDPLDVIRDRVLESGAMHAFKVKISGDIDADAAAVRTVADHAGGKPIWLDANQSYRPSAVRQLLERIADVPHLYCLEQPVPSVDWGGMRRVREMVDLPIAIDEGSFSSADLARSATLDLADLVVVKVCKSGGLRAAQRTVAVAEAHGLEVLASGLTDCGIGFAAALHLFSLVDLALPAELNGPELLAELFVDGLQITDGVAQVPNGPGLGIEVDEDRIRALARPLNYGEQD